MATIKVIPYIRGAYRNEQEVLDAWNNNVTFCTPDEFYSCMSKRNFKDYGNMLDGVTYCWKGLYVILKGAIL